MNNGWIVGYEQTSKYIEREAVKVW